MSQSPIIYEASVYTRKIAYKNFKGEEKETELYFSLDPLRLMEIMASTDVKQVKSGNPARNGKPAAMTEEQQLRFIRDLASQAAGFVSEDGEAWEPFEDFGDSLVGKAFLTKLTSSDGDRKEFAERVILAPFRAFVEYARVDSSNTSVDIKQFDKMLADMENIFKVQEMPAESLQERRARLEAEMAALETAEPQTEA